MWLRNTDLLGLAIGFALGGISLALCLPRIEALIQPAVLPRGNAAAPDVGMPAPSGSRPAIIASPAPWRPAPAPRQELTPLPDIETEPMPQIIPPFHPDRDPGVASTNVFIAAGGTIMARTIRKTRPWIVILPAASPSRHRTQWAGAAGGPPSPIVRERPAHR